MATVPPAPNLWLPGFTGTTVAVDASSNGDGGSPIIQWRVNYGLDPTTPTTQMNLDSAGNGTVTGLTPGKTYYFWAQARNAIGWSAKSVRMSRTLWGYPAAPSAPRFTNVKTSSLDADFTDNDNGGAIINAREIGWIADPAANPTHITPKGSRGVTVIDLPGVTTLYFRGRVKNAVGWSKWGPATAVTLPAGAWVTVVTIGAGWTRVSVRPAVAYLKNAGVWKVATPMVRIAGLWKETR